MIKNIITNWSIFRMIRLAFGILIMVEAVRTGSWFMIMLATLLIILPLLNIGCCAGGQCSVPLRKANNITTQDVEYEEISKMK